MPLRLISWYAWYLPGKVGAGAGGLVRPHGNATVTITLPATEDCDALGAVCTRDGRMLSNEPELTVSGP